MHSINRKYVVFSLLKFFDEIVRREVREARMHCTIEQGRRLYGLLEQLYPFNERANAGWVALSPDQKRAFACRTMLEGLKSQIGQSEATRNSRLHAFCFGLFARSARLASLAEVSHEEFAGAINATATYRRPPPENTQVDRILIANLVWTIQTVTLYGEHTAFAISEPLKRKAAQLCTKTTLFAKHQRLSFESLIVTSSQRSRKSNGEYDLL